MSAVEQNNHQNDELTRARALDLSESFIVRAPAGSGKTTLLVSRYIHLLSVVKDPEEILAMTFTRKATAEMRERVLNILDPDSPHKLPTEKENSMVEKVRQRAVDLNWNLHEQPSRLQIMTIDGLASRLVRTMPWGSRFGSAPRVTEQGDDIYLAAAINTLELDDPAMEQFNYAIRLLYELSNSRTGMLRDLIVLNLKKRDQWLRFLVDEPHAEDAKERMETIWQTLIARDLNELCESFPEKAALELGLDLQLMANPDTGTLELWSDIADVLLTQAGTWRLRMSPSEIFLERQIYKAIAECKTVDGLSKKLHDIGRQFPSPQIDNEYWESLQAISVVLQVAVAQLNLEFRRRGEVDFIEFALQADHALGSPDNPTDLALVMDYRYSHILVDEFQDTSLTQRNMLSKLIAGWNPNDGRTLFMVGDPMQSIYRFREAEVGVFLSVLENGLDNLKPIPLQLVKNFRSNSNLVECFNSIFSEAFPQKMDISRGDVNFTASMSAIGPAQSPSTFLRMRKGRHFSEGKASRSRSEKYSRYFEAHQVVNDIDAYLKRNPEDEVAILVRSRLHATEILNELDRRNMNYYAPRFVELSANNVVRDILSLTRAMLDLADRTSWLAILRAPWCGLTLNDLLVLSSDWDDTIWNRMNNKSVLDSLSSGGRTRMRRVSKVMASALAIRGRLDVRQWVEDTWVSLGGPACVSEVDLKNSELFFDLIEQNAHGTSVANLANFEDTELTELYAVPEHSPQSTQIQISTIHNAKGLEFDAVFIPQLHKTTRPNTKELLAWAEMIFETPILGRKNHLLISPIENETRFNNKRNFRYLNRWNKEKFQTELTRLAYVAFTRAKKELYCYFQRPSSNRPPSDGSLLGRISPDPERYQVHVESYEESELSEADFNYDSNSDEFRPLRPTLVRLPKKWKLPPAPPPLKLTETQMEAPGNIESIDFDWAGKIAVWVGFVTHDWLRLIGETGLENWNAQKIRSQKPRWTQRLHSMGVASKGKDIKIALERIETALLQVLEDETGRWILNNNHASCHNEYRLTGYIDGQFKNVVLDRTFVDDKGTRWIVDYKTGITLGDKDEFLENEVKRYTEQLKLYQKIMANMDSTPIRLGLYFPMFPDWREIA